MGGVIRDSLIDQEVNRTILTTFNGDRSAFLKNLSLSGMTIRAFREMTKNSSRFKSCGLPNTTRKYRLLRRKYSRNTNLPKNNTGT